MFATTGTLVPQRSAEGFEGECNDKRAFLVSLLIIHASLWEIAILAIPQTTIPLDRKSVSYSAQASYFLAV
jgi:hypothetical protein